ncbi:protein nubbin-like [Armigeres subalbatus]|uniref:protein nubbin-like n=1 Tax=Armigeres subalbatus TaxID=124917 RepID=UPI002ED110E5
MTATRRISSYHSLNHPISPARLTPSSIFSFHLQDRERSDNCSRSNSPLDESSRAKVAAALRSREKMSPLSLPTGGSPVTNQAAAAAAAAAAAQVHLNGTMQDMLNLQKLQSLAQLTGGAGVLPGLGLPTAGLPSALLNNSPLNLSLGAQSHSPVMGALGAASQPLTAAAAQMPQMILASGQIVQGIQGAQLLIPTSQGIATQTILTIPVGQQVISSMSSENLLQCLNFNTVASNNFNDMLNQSSHHHHHPHHPSNAAFAAAAAAAAAVATRESPVTVNSAINTTSLLTNQLALAAAAAANSNHHHHHQHQHQQQQQQQQQHQLQQQQQQAALHQSQQTKHLHLGLPAGLPSSASSSSTSSAIHVADKFKNLSTHEKTPSERSTPEMRIKLESPKVPSPITLTPQSRPPSNSFASVFEKSPQMKRTSSPSIAACSGSNSSTGSGGSNSSVISGLSSGGSIGHGQIHVAKNLTSPHHSPSDNAISRISTSNGEITVTKSQAPPTPPLSVQKNHPASLHFNPSISPQPLIHHARDLHQHQHQQHQQQQHHQLSVPSSHNSTHSALTVSTQSAPSSLSSCALLAGDSHHHLAKEQQGLQLKPSASSTSTSAAVTPGVISLTLDDVEQKISPHSVGSSSSKRHRSLTPPPRKMSPAGSIQHSHRGDNDDDDDDGEDEDNHSANHELDDSPNELTINQTNCNVVDGIDLDDIKEFAKAFKLRRLSLGLTQTQVGQALSVTEGPAYSQSAICSALAAQMYCAAQLSSQQQQMFEKLDITPKSAQKIKPVLERWMKEAEESHSSRFKSGQNHLTDFIGVEPSKKRKRRTSFTPQALELLNGHFERNTHPSGTEITGLAHQLGYEREVIRIWFCNKRQALKNTLKITQ